MPEWEQSPFDKKTFSCYTDDWSIWLSDTSTLNITGHAFRFGPAAMAKTSILAQAQRLRQIADEIEAAVASAPKEVPDA